MHARLRGCPTCGTRVADLDLGLRDYRWVSGRLPGSVGPMDVDFILERKGHVLILEFKPEGVGLPVGQRMTFRTLEKMGCTVWVVQGDGPNVTVSRPGGAESRIMSVEALAKDICEWYEEASI